MGDARYVADARRFDMGERDHFISLEMASIGMEMMAEWGQEAIQERLQMLTDRLAAGLRKAGVSLAARRFPAPHILSLKFPGGIPEGWIHPPAAESGYVAPRPRPIRLNPR